MRSATKILAFPLAGVSRRGPHASQQQGPFTAPWAVNMRTVGVSELRRRGGSRPGLAKHCETQLGTSVTSLIPVTYVDAGGTRRNDLVYVADLAVGYVRGGVATATTAELEGPDGVDILDDNNVTIDFSSAVVTASLQGAVRGGRIYFADDVLKTYDPATGVVEPVIATAGTVPVAEPLIAVYRDRIFLAGLTNAYYASRVGDPGDWSYGAAIEDPSAAVAGQLSTSGDIGRVLTAMIPVNDQVLVLATENGLWVLRGDPRTGSLSQVSDEIGVIHQDAWAMSPDGTLVFLSNDGVYVWQAGSSQAPARFSAERVPEELRELDVSTYTVSMAYDPKGRGFHLFVTAAAPGQTDHWWIDVVNRAFWPQRFRTLHEPLASATLVTTDLGKVILASRDGYLREFEEGRDNDDNSSLASHLLIGPVRLGANEVTDGMLAEIHGTLEGLTGDVTWRVVTGRSAAEAAEAALADLDDVLDGLAPSRASSSGTWSEGRGRVQRPRARGAWVVVWLSSAAAWSYEVVAIVTRELGRLR